MRGGRSTGILPKNPCIYCTKHSDEPSCTGEGHIVEWPTTARPPDACPVPRSCVLRTSHAVSLIPLGLTRRQQATSRLRVRCVADRPGRTPSTCLGGCRPG